MVTPTIHTNPSRNGTLRKRSSNRKNLKTSALRLVWTQLKHFECDFSARVFLKHKSNIISDCRALFQMSRAARTENRLMRFQVENTVLNFLRRLA